jgi:hypothetical protein
LDSAHKVSGEEDNRVEDRAEPGEGEEIISGQLNSGSQKQAIV